MPADSRLLELSTTYKTALLEFIQKPRYQRVIRQIVDQTFGDEEPTEAELLNTVDYFMLEYRFPDGRTVIDDYLKAHPRLPDDEREMLLGWKGVIEAILRAERVDGGALIATNLVDDLTYRVRANVGSQFFDRTPPGTFLNTRLTPLQDEWVMSGMATLLPKTDTILAYAMTEDLQLSRPDLVFRNPAKPEQAWALQLRDRERCIDFFGSDLIVLPAGELTERYEAYLYSNVDDDIPDDDLDALEDEDGLYNPAFDSILDLMDDLSVSGVATFGLIHDEVEGFSFYLDFALFEEAFANPDLVAAASCPHRKILRAYLRDDSISPLPFRRMVERYPENADRVFRILLRMPSFTWQRDGEGLMRRHKAAFFEKPPVPKVVPTIPLPDLDTDITADRERLSNMLDALWKEPR